MAERAKDRHRERPAKRWGGVALRALHLLGIAGIGGGYLWGADPALWRPYLWLAIGSGFALATLQAWGNRAWLGQVRGVAVIAKLPLLAMLAWWPEHAGALFAVVVVGSAVFAHAPAELRHRVVVATGPGESSGQSM